MFLEGLELKVLVFVQMEGREDGGKGGWRKGRMEDWRWKMRRKERKK